jgi:hypothetical protein
VTRNDGSSIAIRSSACEIRATSSSVSGSITTPITGWAPASREQDRRARIGERVAGRQPAAAATAPVTGTGSVGPRRSYRPRSA